MFIHLHNHSHYSLLDGLPKIDDYVKKALEYKMPALALTDHGNMYGAVEFYQKCKAAGIKPIIGCEMYVAPRSLELKHYGLDNKAYHLILLAKNLEGYKNLIYLTTVAHLDGFYYKPRIDKKILAEKSAGLIASSACMNGEVPKTLNTHGMDKAKKVVEEYQKIFGKGNFYLELQHIGKSEEQEQTNAGLIKLAKKTKAPLIAAHDTHYIDENDKFAQDALVCVQTGKVLSDTNRLNMTKFDLSFKHPKLMEELFKHVPEAIKNTEKIAAECNVNLDLGQWYFPKFELPTGVTPEQQLRNEAEQGLQEKFPDADEKVKARLEYELNTICKKGYAPYFLIVSDLIKFAKRNKIPTTTRGSAAGSLVGHVTEIIPIDPLFFELPFERFLNPFRISAPDIDMDFADNRREEVLNYAREKYGYDKVANISTFGTMAARGSVRDITRVLDLPYAFGDRLSKLIPMGAQGFPMTIARAMKEVPELKQMYDTNPDAKKVIDLAQKIEGCARHVSVHAAGVVVSPTILTDFVPLQKDPTGQRGIITQYEMHASEAVGLIKFDFLGIRNLSILGDAVQIIKKTKDVEIDLANIPIDEKDTFGFISAGHTFGMFQLGGSGMTKWLTQLKPTKIKELAAMIALFRPGPMDSIPEYIARKQGKKPIEYLDPRMEKILKDTYGVITYQDDIMLIAIEFAGYTWETVDKFRKAIGKKIPELMAEQEKNLVEGCQKHSGWSKEKADQLWSMFDPFKGYGFGRAHAASYAMVAYQTAYLKTHYTAEFMTAVMTAEAQNTDKLVEAVEECKRLDIEVSPPDVNFSRPDFTYISDTEIRFGLLAIKNLGTDIANVIIANRKEHGQFKSLEDFLTRVETKNLNKKSLDALIKSGAMDSLGERNQMLENMDNILSFIRYKNKQKNSRQVSLFSSLQSANGEKNELSLTPAVTADPKTKLAWEKELLGLYVSGHPFSDTQNHLEPHVTCCCAQVDEQTEKTIKVAGVISKIHKIFTKKNELMMFVTLSDTSGEVEVIVFPKTLEQTAEHWQEDAQVLVMGKKSDKDDKIKIIANTVYQIDINNLDELAKKIQVDLDNPKDNFKKFNNHGNNYNYNFADAPNSTGQVAVGRTFTPMTPPTPTPPPEKIEINLPQNFNSEIHSQLKQIFSDFTGPTQVYLIVTQNGGARKIETDFKINYSQSFKIKLEQIVGNGNIKE